MNENEHECRPEWSTLQAADDAPGIIDVWCSCGASGSVSIDPKDIQWD